MAISRIATDAIQDNSITTAKTVDSIITADKIADGAINETKLSSTLDLSSNTISLPDDVVAPVTLLHSGTYSGSASVIRWDLDNTNYRFFEAYFDDIKLSADGDLSINYANVTNGEPAGWFGGVYAIGENNTSGYNGAFAAQPTCRLTNGLGTATNGVYFFSGKVGIYPQSVRCKLTWHMVGRTGTGFAQNWMGGALTTDVATNWPKFVLKHTQNITEVTYRIYGYK